MSSFAEFLEKNKQMPKDIEFKEYVALDMPPEKYVVSVVALGEFRLNQTIEYWSKRLGDRKQGIKQVKFEFKNQLWEIEPKVLATEYLGEAVACLGEEEVRKRLEAMK